MCHDNVSFERRSSYQDRAVEAIHVQSLFRGRSLQYGDNSGETCDLFIAHKKRAPRPRPGLVSVCSPVDTYPRP